ncbi:MAG: CDP-alcohol phosphatidyltransferase family protein [Caldilineaceae bacterium]|nr:CDP-alcohol phosphatidyltransferase family protein [Caldilineaceae bacterium]MCB9137372.1 CDP-alcohol phosphatidyltransferase family protein [Caldilineaceae bacterium]
MFSDIGRRLLAGPLRKLTPLLQATGISPNGLSVIGFLLTALIALLLARGFLVTGGILLVFAAFFDTLDGALARATNQSTPFGAFLDSTLDRFSEGVVFIALTYYYANLGDQALNLTLISAALLGSLMVSYARARAEALGYSGKVGLLQRPERIAVLVVGLIGGWMTSALIILALFANVTAVQRILAVRQEASRALADTGVDQ